ncbi:MAG: helix-turn-helix transcriptional regulator [Streptococcus sp.]|nr:helix-turn-helix transcriptional regulator [Streptococcus sp.]
MTIFAHQLKKFRTEKNLSQEDLAQKLFISRQSISKWETNEATPDMDNLIKLSDILQVSLDELVFAKPKEVRVERVFDKKSIDTKKIISIYWIIFGNLVLTFFIILLIILFLETIGISLFK